MRSVIGGDTHQPVPISATQMTSLVFYVIVFWQLTSEYSPRGNGLGHLSSDLFKELDPLAQSLLKMAILWIIVMANAIRYYWSAWLIEQNETFSQLRRFMPWIHKAFEFLLRFTILILLYLMQFTLSTQMRGHSFETILILIFLSLFLWDLHTWYWVRSLSHELSRTLTGQSNPASSQTSLFLRLKSTATWIMQLQGQLSDDLKEKLTSLTDELRDLKTKIMLWTLLEGVGLVASVVYWAIVVWVAPESWISTVLLVGALATVFLIIALVDVIVQRTAYFNLQYLGVFVFGLAVSFGLSRWIRT